MFLSFQNLIGIDGKGFLQTNSPFLFINDFPLSENESWNLVTNLTKTFTKIGTSDLITIDIPTEPEYYDQEWSFLINATGEVGFSGCEDSTLIWMLDEEGEVEEWRWWCPAVGQYAVRWTDDIALDGVNASLVLVDYQHYFSSNYDYQHQQSIENLP